VVLAVILAATRPGVLVAIRRDGFGLLLYGVLAMHWSHAHGTQRRSAAHSARPVCRATTLCAAGTRAMAAPPHQAGP